MFNLFSRLLTKATANWLGALYFLSVPQRTRLLDTSTRPSLYQWRKYAYGRLVARRRLVDCNLIAQQSPEWNFVTIQLSLFHIDRTVLNLVIKVLIMQTAGDHKFPHFYNYPPYFTLQPVRETREKQMQLWKELILDYCRTQKIFVIGLEQDFPLFTNPAIERSLNHEAREAFLSALVSDGRAEWMDKNRRQCLILWHRIKDWADLILNFVKENGLEDSVMTVDEIRTGIESRGTDIHGMDRTVLLRALKLLENKGKLAIFKGTSADDEGVKFSV